MEDIHNSLLGRLKLGKEKYGHGVRVDLDTQTWGTQKNSWLEMASEEFLDGIIYVACDYIRQGRKNKHEPGLMSKLEFRYNYSTDFEESEDPQKWLEEHREKDDNNLIMYVIRNRKTIESYKHKYLLERLTNILSFCLLND